MSEVWDIIVPVVALASSTLCLNYPLHREMVLGGILFSETWRIQAIWFSQLWPGATAPASPDCSFSLFVNIYRLFLPLPSACSWL